MNIILICHRRSQLLKFCHIFEAFINLILEKGHKYMACVLCLFLSSICRDLLGCDAE